ncbi:MaoC family dehydratase N-terminal domain-containing protein [Streptomyces xiamenensis]|uniref:MaoC family dehydratase n=1 Tax=Streptomyces xiamenensis TaxID=408015 RepID=UPI0036EB5209
MINDTERQPKPDPLLAEAIDQLITANRPRVGCVAPDLEPGLDVASWINVSRFVEATGDENPLFTDVQYGAGSAHHTMLAPPSFVLTIHMPDSHGGLALDGHRLVEIGWSLTLTWNDTIRIADPLTGSAEVADLSRGHDGSGRALARVTTAVRYQRHGVALAEGTCQVSLAPVVPGPPERPIHHYEPGDIDRMVRELDTEEPARGGRPRFWGDTSVGEMGPTLLKGPLSLAELMVWEFAEGRPVRAGNLHHNRLSGLTGRQTVHPVTGWPAWDRAEAWLDSATAPSEGLPAPAARGGLLYALASQYVTHWMGDDAFLRRLDVEVLRPLLYGDALRLFGTVTDRYTVTDRAAQRYHAVTLRVAGDNQLGKAVLAATATVFLPERGKPVRLPVTGTPAFEHTGAE